MAEALPRHALKGPAETLKLLQTDYRLLSAHVNVGIAAMRSFTAGLGTHAHGQ